MAGADLSNWGPTRAGSPSQTSQARVSSREARLTVPRGALAVAQVGASPLPAAPHLANKAWEQAFGLRAAGKFYREWARGGGGTLLARVQLTSGRVLSSRAHW